MSPRKKTNTSKDDNKKSTYLANNLSHLRQLKGSTLEDVSVYLGLSGRSSYRAYESGDAVPPLHLLLKMASFFDVSLDELVRIDLKNSSLTNPEKDSNEPDVPVVPIKARAGYVSGFQDYEFINGLETIKIPFKPFGIARAFQIDGTSMEPEVSDGSYVVGIKIDKNELQSGKNYVVVTLDGEILYKTVVIGENQITLLSTNPQNPPQIIEPESIKEMWRYYCHVNKTDN